MLKKHLGLDLVAGRVPRLGCRMICFPPAHCFAVPSEKSLWEALACPWYSWLVMCSPCFLAASCSAQMELPGIAASCMYCVFVTNKNT